MKRSSASLPCSLNTQLAILSIYTIWGTIWLGIWADQGQPAASAKPPTKWSWIMKFWIFVTTGDLLPQGLLALHKISLLKFHTPLSSLQDQLTGTLFYYVLFSLRKKADTIWKWISLHSKHVLQKIGFHSVPTRRQTVILFMRSGSIVQV